MPQSAFLFDDTVRDNVTLGADVPDEEVWEALRTAQADGFVAGLPHGLDSRLGERGTTLSGGQRQRLSLARALVRQPAPAGPRRRDLRRRPRGRSADPGGDAARGGDSTLLLIAYRKATIALADEVLFLDGGRIADRGTHEELLDRNPAYATAGQRLRDRGRGAMSAVGPRPRSCTATAPRRQRRGDLRHARRSGAAWRYSPELGEGFRWTLLLAVLGTAGRVVVPIAVQQTLDRGINGPSGVDLVLRLQMAVAAALAIVLTGVWSYFMTARLFTASERGLATLRIKAFRHVHDLPLLTQNTERRGALVSRVTSDVDQVSQFLVFGGVFGIISVGQVAARDRGDALLLMAADHPGVGLLPAAVPLAALLPASALGRLRRSYAARSARCSRPSPSRSSAR